MVVDDDADIGAELLTALSKTRQVLSTRQKDLTDLEEHLEKLADSEDAAAKSAIRRLNKRKESHAKEAAQLTDAVDAITRAMDADEAREEHFSALMSEKEAEIARIIDEEKKKLSRKLDVARQDVEMFKVQTRDAKKAQQQAEAALEKASKGGGGGDDDKELAKLEKKIAAQKKAAEQAVKTLQDKILSD